LDPPLQEQEQDSGLQEWELLFSHTTCTQCSILGGVDPPLQKQEQDSGLQEWELLFSHTTYAEQWLININLACKKI
jgi:hypothetical protein